MRHRVRRLGPRYYVKQARVESASTVAPLKFVFVKSEDGYINLPKTWRDVVKECILYKNPGGLFVCQRWTSSSH